MTVLRSATGAAMRFLEYHRPEQCAAWRYRAALVLSVVEGVLAGALMVALWPLLIVILPVFSLAFPLHLCRMTPRSHVAVGLFFSASFALAATVIARWPNRTWWDYAWTFTSIFLISGGLSLLISVPLTLSARRAA